MSWYSFVKFECICFYIIDYDSFNLTVTEEIVVRHFVSLSMYELSRKDCGKLILNQMKTVDLFINSMQSKIRTARR